jgi:hypothetical protein
MLCHAPIIPRRILGGVFASEDPEERRTMDRFLALTCPP